MRSEPEHIASQLAPLARDRGGHWYRGEVEPCIRPRRTDGPRVGVVAPKNTREETEWICDFLDYPAEPYRRYHRYDVVLFINVSEELRFLGDNTDCRLVAMTLEPRTALPANYDPALLDRCDLYLGYRNFASSGFRGEFRPLRFPATTRAEIDAVFEDSLRSDRPVDFCIFANHDPNYRTLLGKALARRNSILAGPLFGNPVASKIAVQRLCKYEVITESDINDYYFSEKLAQALLAGCIPVYYGCTTVSRQVPRGLFVPLQEDDFRGDRLERLLDDLQRPEVLLDLQTRLREDAARFLRESCTMEMNVAAPIDEFLSRLAGSGFRAKRRSWRWWTRALRAVASPRRLRTTIRSADATR